MLLPPFVALVVYFILQLYPFLPLQERFGAPVDTDSEELFRAMSTFLKQFLAARKDLYPDWNPQEYVINAYEWSYEELVG